MTVSFLNLAGVGLEPIIFIQIQIQKISTQKFCIYFIHPSELFCQLK